MTDAEPAAKPAISPKRRRIYIAVMLSCWFAVLGIIGLKILEYRGEYGLRRTDAPRARRPLQPGLEGGVTHPLFDDDAFVLDDLTYVSPRPEYVAKRISNSIRGDREAVFPVTHVERGIIRHEPVGPEPGRPTVLLLGDSHTYGTVRLKEHVYYLLEQNLREEPGCAEATVINGGCPFFSPYQYVLRPELCGITLIPTW